MTEQGMGDSDRAVQRESLLGVDISGTHHHYGQVEWVPPERFGDEYERPKCPVAQLGSVDKSVGCPQITHRLTNEDGQGAWLCPWHGVFRVFDYPRDRLGTEQATFRTLATGRNVSGLRTATDDDRGGRDV